MKYLACTLALGVALFASEANSQTFKTLLQFTGTGGTASGRGTFGSLTLSGTTLYGMTQSGGTNGLGNIFSLAIDGTNYHNLVSFSGTGGATSGEYPSYGRLTLGGSTLYGMTQSGGSNGQGNVFSVGTDGTNFQNLVSFASTGGSGFSPQGSLTLSGSTLYGMTYYGGSALGTVFSVGTNATNYRNLVT